jgi:tetratricopeptide (TPR) repeat protein
LKRSNPHEVEDAMMRRAVVLLSLFLAAPASAQEEMPPFASVLEHARAQDARTEYEAAVALYEAYANACLAQPTAVLERGQPCAELAPALERAFELARALGDAASADRIAGRYAEHLLYAEPRAALRVGYDLARLHLDAGRLERAEAALARWVEDNPDPPVGHQILVDAMRARIAMTLGRGTRATAFWRRVERGYERDREELAEDGAVPLALVHEAVAEGRLLRAEALVRRFLATEPPMLRGSPREADLYAQVLMPWRGRAERRLLIARMELERVYELASPRYSVIAAARIGEMYGHYAALHAALEPVPLGERQRAFLTNGEMTPGYELARAHYETCVTWSRHHGVAERWALRCGEGLHALDPDRYPVPTELVGEGGYHPVSVALPAVPR